MGMDLIELAFVFAFLQEGSNIREKALSWENILWQLGWLWIDLMMNRFYCSGLEKFSVWRMMMHDQEQNPLQYDHLIVP